VSVRSLGHRTTCVMLFCGCLVIPSAVNAQSVSGVVVDGASNAPIAGVLVRATEANQVTLTDTDGTFSLAGPFADSVLLEFSRLGYQSTQLDLVRSDELRVLLSRSPVELDGLEAVVGFQTVAEVAEALDRRYAGFRGTTRTVSAATIRQYDERHASDPYALLADELDTNWDFEDVYDIVRINRLGRTRVEVFVDERQTSLHALVQFPNGRLCHANVYTPVRALGPIPNREPPPQIRFYSCSYMARVLAGVQEFPRRVCWGDLISAPYQVGGLGGCMRTDLPAWMESR